MDATRLRQVFEQLDASLEHPTELLIRGGAAVLAHGLEQRVDFLVRRFRLTESDLRESFERLPARFQADPVVQDNLRYVIEDFL